MARIKDAALRAEGEGDRAVLTVVVDIDWDRGDDDQTYELAIRFIGADAGLRGGDEVVKVHVVPVRPRDGEQVTVTVDNADRVFNEDAGGDDEVLAECELRTVSDASRVKRTNKVTGNF